VSAERPSAVGASKPRICTCGHPSDMHGSWSVCNAGGCRCTGFWASRPEPHPEAQRVYDCLDFVIGWLMGGTPRDREHALPYLQKARESADVLVGRLEHAERIVDAARRLHHFLEEEKETFEPPRELLDQGYVALETSADYEREEELAMALGEALGVPPPEGSP
jgi:hypothetical protein